jgi:hypothetical protein
MWWPYNNGGQQIEPKRKNIPSKAKINSQGFDAPSSRTKASNNPCSSGCGKSDPMGKWV